MVHSFWYVSFMKDFEDLIVSNVLQEYEKKYAFRDFSEDDTYACRELKTALQKKIFWKYLNFIGIPNRENERHQVYHYIYRIDRANHSLRNQYVFYSREKLQPSKWYYKVTEPLPERIKFTPKFDVSVLRYKESLGHIKLNELKETYSYSLTGLARAFSLDVNQVKNVLFKKWNPLLKKQCFRALPSENFIIQMRDIINPDLWYIFPEEVE